MLLKVSIGLGEVSATNEPAICTQRTWMNRSKDQMFASVNELSFALCITTPKHKDNVRSLIIKRLYGCVSQFFPPLSLVTPCFVSFYSQSGIEQQNTLLCPMREVTGSGNWFAEIAVEFLVNINQ